MKIRHLHILLMFTILLLVGCEEDLPGKLDIDNRDTQSNSFILIKSENSEGIINMAIDAPADSRFDVWIDLNGDGTRAANGSEDVKTFNQYHQYFITSNNKEVMIYGNITYLAASSNDIVSIDVSGNVNISTLNIPNNKISFIDLSENKQLRLVDLSGNNLTSLDVLQNNMLESLWIFNNSLSTLILPENSNLSVLDVSNNRLRNISLQGCKNINTLLVFNNELTSLDISQLTNINMLWAYDNNFTDSEILRINDSLSGKSVSDIWITAN